MHRKRLCYNEWVLLSNSKAVEFIIIYFLVYTSLYHLSWYVYANNNYKFNIISRELDPYCFKQFKPSSVIVEK